MPSFNIFGSSTTAQTLNNIEAGFIGQNGALATIVPLSVPVTISGKAQLVVLGSITALYERCVVSTTVPSISITVGSTGTLVSSAEDAIRADFTTQLTLVNDGFISGAAEALDLNAGDDDADVEIRNTGIISAGLACVEATLGEGAIRISNAGTLMTTAGGTALNLSAASITLQNAGTIIGDAILFSGTAGEVLLVNSGLIDGDVTLGNGNDEFVNAGGRINGAVSGGLGDDTYRIDSAITIQDSGGNDSIYSSVSYDIAAGIERLILTGTADIRANGNVQANVIAGNSGDNRISGQRGSDELSGGNGDDTLRGGGGNETLVFDAGDDVLNGGGGIDTLDLSTATDAFLVNLGAGSMTGDATDNDTVTAVENVRGGSGADTLLGSGDANALSGGSGDDSLVGSGGADTLTGQSGADTLVGGDGADLFRFERFSDSPEAGPDTIADFRTAQGDLIDLSLIDANGLGSGNGTFLFSSAGFLPEGVPSVRVLQDIANNLTIVEARDSVGAAMDLRIILTGLVTLTAADFAL